MADIGITKAALRSTTAAQSDGGQGTQKAGPSKFDSVRSQLSEQLADSLKMPAAKPISDQQAASMETALRKRLTQTVAKSPSEVFSHEMKTTRVELNRLTSAVNQLPNNKTFAPLRDSLASIESEYQKSAQLVNGSQSMDPQSLLKMQMQLYQMSGHLQLFSKVVDQVTSGVKTIFQTQVG